MTSAAAAIRDRCHVLIEALTPTSDGNLSSPFTQRPPSSE